MRQNAKMKVDQLKYDVRHLQVNCAIILIDFLLINCFQTALSIQQQKRQRRELEDSEREHLLQRRFQANPETTIELDYSLQHHTQMNNAHQGVDEMLSTGGNILNSLRNQRDLLKGARNKMMSIGSTLGLSDHTMRLIERRMQEDKYVMIGGMFITLFIIGLVIYFLV